MSGPGRIFPLVAAQAAAADPTGHRWLSASAGTGKTQVLSARVLRLLLTPCVGPENILCITFTKAGAAEMADRVSRTLAAWVRMPAADLAADLKAIGADFAPPALARARTLFARLLDAPGGLRVETIHGFAQGLLAAFPVEAGLIPGVRPLDDRDSAELAREVLAGLIADATLAGDTRLIEAMQALSRRHGEGDALGYLMRWRGQDALEPFGDQDAIAAIARRLAGLDFEGDAAAELVRQCGASTVPASALRKAIASTGAWGATGREWADCMARWLDLAPQDRAAGLMELHSCFATKDGSARKWKPGLLKIDPDYPRLAQELADWCSGVLAIEGKAELADRLSGALWAGRAFAAAWRAAKRARGAIDFDDMIALSAELLKQPGIGDWIRFKLDARIDHILVDEAQDTNRAQWDIVKAVAEDYFQIEGEKGERLRTLFTVGDFKQAIFGFQGSAPEHFEAARAWFRDRAAQTLRPLVDVALDRSFRSTPPVLEAVDAMLAEVGASALGMADAVPPHATGRPAHGGLLLFPPVTSEEEDGESEDEEAGEESWLAEHERIFAGRLAVQLREWLDPASPLKLLAEGGRALRSVQPGDVMILVKSRGDLAALIVARLYAEGVPVAGLDRLTISRPLAVQDLLGAIRFVLQPDDDLNLANLLVSPLIGFDQDRLFAAAHGRGKRPLWQVVREDPAFADAAAPLAALLARADYGTPYRFLEHVLSGPMQGRRRLLERLDREARVPIEELCALALAHERDHAPSLEGFLRWIERGDVPVKREGAGSEAGVRVMTAHGSKGLQAPLVILADATRNPDHGPKTGRAVPFGDGAIPIPPVPKALRHGVVQEAAEDGERREAEEHLRLLYVAMTRAEEWLVVAGSTGKRGPGKRSWHGIVGAALDRLDAQMIDDPRWGSVRRHATIADLPGKDASPEVAERTPLPDWAARPAPVEARPPRPLAPSSQGPDDAPRRPAGPAMAKAAARGRLLHSLFERLPAVEPAAREAAALRWLAAQGRGFDEAEQAAMAAQAVTLLADRAFAHVFTPGGLAEAPIAARVGEAVIAGTVDRLVILPDRIAVIDYKTGSDVPADAAAVPMAYVRQMARYVAALEALYPRRAVAAALLYTHAPRLIELSAALLAPHKIL